jgi:hypothetical protein
MWNYCNTMVLVVTTITGYYGKCLPHYIVIVTTNHLCLIRTNASCRCKCMHIYLEITKHETIMINYAFVHNCSHVLTHNSSNFFTTYNIIVVNCLTYVFPMYDMI